jgi:hypothetical protein
VIFGVALAGCEGLVRWEPPDGLPDAEEGATVDSGAVTDAAGTACYPGADRGFSACLDLVTDPVPPEDYVYPPPLDGSPQYEAPTAFLDLAASDPFLAIAPSFLLAEVADAGDGGSAVVQVHAIASLQAVRDRVGALIVSSGYRSPAHNAAVGGATWSRHIYGDAFDLMPLYVTLDELAEACWDEGASFVETYASHVHCDWRDEEMDEEFFTGSGG